MVFFSLHYRFDFFKLYELINRLKGNFGVILDGFEIHHFVHVVWRNWAHDFLVILVVPHLLVLLQLALVQLVEQGKWSRLVHFLPFLMFFVHLVCIVMLLLPDFYILVSSFLFLHLMAHCNIDAIRVMLSRLAIFRLEAGLAEQALDGFHARLKLQSFEVDSFKSL